MTLEEFKKEMDRPKSWSLKGFCVTLFVGFSFGFMTALVMLLP